MLPHTEDQQADTTHDHTQPIVVPEDVDSERKPQLNETICDRDCGCTCSLSRGRTMTTPGLTSGESEESSDDEGTSVDGEQGVDHSIEVGDLGMVPISVIMSALAKHSRCTCHHAVLPSDEDYPSMRYTSRQSSGFFSIDSMNVRYDTESIATVSSESGSIRSCERCSSSVLLSAVGGQFDTRRDSVQRTPAVSLHDLTAADAPSAVILARTLSFTSLPEYDMW